MLKYLKYTAELSQQFRRASSLNSIEARHRAKVNPIKKRMFLVQKEPSQTIALDCWHHKFNSQSIDKIDINGKRNYYSQNWNGRTQPIAMRGNNNKIDNYGRGVFCQGRYTNSIDSQSNIQASHLLHQRNTNIPTNNNNTTYSKIANYHSLLKTHELHQNPQFTNYRYQTRSGNENIKNISDQNLSDNRMKVRDSRGRGVRMANINNLGNIQKRIRNTMGLKGLGRW